MMTFRVAGHAGCQCWGLYVAPPFCKGGATEFFQRADFWQIERFICEQLFSE